MFKGRELSEHGAKISALDGLRGLAVLLVFFSHTSNAGYLLIPSFSFSGVGTYGVFLFFVLSSFLLTRPFLRNGKNAFKKKHLLNYFIRRFFRVYPLYLFFLLLALVSSILFSIVLNKNIPVGVPFHLTLENFFNQLTLQEGKSITWSIVVEFHYYFVLPFIALAYSVVLKNKILPSLIMTLLLILVVQMFWPASQMRNDEIRLGPYLPVFFIGSFLAVIDIYWKENGWDKDKNIQMILDISGVLAMMILFFMIPSVSSFIQGEKLPIGIFHRELILISVLWAVVLLACVNGRDLFKRVFSSVFLRYLGLISFSIYLSHLVGIRIVKNIGLNWSVDGWLMLAITVVMSHVTFVVIERPASKIRIC